MSKHWTAMIQEQVLPKLSMHNPKTLPKFVYFSHEILFNAHESNSTYYIIWIRIIGGSCTNRNRLTGNTKQTTTTNGRWLIINDQTFPQDNVVIRRKCNLSCGSHCFCLSFSLFSTWRTTRDLSLFFTLHLNFFIFCVIIHILNTKKKYCLILIVYLH